MVVYPTDTVTFAFGKLSVRRAESEIDKLGPAERTVVVLPSLDVRAIPLPPEVDSEVRVLALESPIR